MVVSGPDHAWGWTTGIKLALINPDERSSAMKYKSNFDCRWNRDLRNCFDADLQDCLDFEKASFLAVCPFA
jgi:hypothetical protein